MREKIQCSKIFDVIIIGAGPAGITSAIYLARMKLCILVIYEIIGGQTANTDGIENYTGFRIVSGGEFKKKLDEHISDYDVTLKEEKAEGIEKMKKLFKVSTGKNIYLGKAVIIASGGRRKKLKIPGEEKFGNRGVSYCSICDAPLFRNKDVAIIGGGNTALETALHLEKYAKKIYLITINKEMKGQRILIEKVKDIKNVKIMPLTKTKEIKGEKFVKSIIVEENGKEKEIPVQGIFIAIGHEPNSDFTNVEKNSKKEIIINEKNETSLKGIFAAGDVTNIPPKQIIISAGEGAKAALSAAEYLSESRR